MITSDEIRKAIRNSDGFRALCPDTAIGGDRQAAKIAIDVMELLSNRGIPFEISGANGVVQHPYGEPKMKKLSGREEKVLRNALLKSTEVVHIGRLLTGCDDWCPKCGEYGAQCTCFVSNDLSE